MGEGLGEGIVVVHGRASAEGTWDDCKAIWTVGFVAAREMVLGWAPCLGRRALGLLRYCAFALKETKWE